MSGNKFLTLRAQESKVKHHTQAPHKSTNPQQAWKEEEEEK